MISQLGKLGEDIATRYLSKQGYKVVERNFRIRNGEIDIIALDPTNQTLVFIEVKTRDSTQFGSPFEAIGFYKLKFITRTANYYSVTHPKLPRMLRIDAIAVTFKQGVSRIEHEENISL